MKIYGDIQSGNCYKTRLLASLLDMDREWVHVDLLPGEKQTNNFLTDLLKEGEIPSRAPVQ